MSLKNLNDIKISILNDRDYDFGEDLAMFYEYYQDFVKPQEYKKLGKCFKKLYCSKTYNKASLEINKINIKIDKRISEWNEKFKY